MLPKEFFDPEDRRMVHQIASAEAGHLPGAEGIGPQSHAVVCVRQSLLCHWRGGCYVVRVAALDAARLAVHCDKREEEA